MRTRTPHRTLHAIITYNLGFDVFRFYNINIIIYCCRFPRAHYAGRAVFYCLFITPATMGKRLDFFFRSDRRAQSPRYYCVFQILLLLSSACTRKSITVKRRGILFFFIISFSNEASPSVDTRYLLQSRENDFKTDLGRSA